MLALHRAPHMRHAATAARHISWCACRSRWRCRPGLELIVAGAARRTRAHIVLPVIHRPGAAGNRGRNRFHFGDQLRACLRRPARDRPLSLPRERRCRASGLARQIADTSKSARRPRRPVSSSSSGSPRILHHLGGIGLEALQAIMLHVRQHHAHVGGHLHRARRAVPGAEDGAGGAEPDIGVRRIEALAKAGAVVAARAAVETTKWRRLSMALSRFFSGRLYQAQTGAKRGARALQRNKSGKLRASSAESG